MVKVIAAWCHFEGDDAVRYAICEDGSEWRKVGARGAWCRAGRPLPYPYAIDATPPVHKTSEQIGT